MSFNNTLFQKYLDYQQPRGSSRRYGECPFCGKANRLAFVVTRTPKGFVCWCHRCHRTTSVNNRVPSARDCLRIADEHMRNEIQPLRKHVKRDPARVSEVKKAYVALPFDVTKIIPLKALLWLNKYNVTKEELEAYGICYSPVFERLILPVYDVNKRLIYWQGRYFGDGSSDKHPKYFNVRSTREDIWFDTKTDSEVIVVVEDILSALAIGRSGYRAIALLGSYISDSLILRLQALTNESNAGLQSKGKQVCVWLDLDKQCESLRYSKRLNVFGVRAKTIITELDPKEYTNQRIQKEISHALSNPTQFDDSCDQTYDSIQPQQQDYNSLDSLLKDAIERSAAPSPCLSNTSPITPLTDEPPLPWLR